MSKAPADVNYTFSTDQLEFLKGYGRVQSHAESAVLTEEGDTRQA